MASLRLLGISVSVGWLVLLQCPVVETGIALRGQKHLSHPDEDAGSGHPFTRQLGIFVNDLLAEWSVPGLSVAVVDGQEVYAQGYGYAVLPDTPATPETLWHGGSTTKAFVDAALAQLISNGSYSVLSRGWSTPISSIIRDDFVLQHEWATNHLTLEDAASHRTGMPRHDHAWVRLKHGKRVSNRDLVRNLRHLPLTAPPRVILQYCNLMYITLSHVVETITGTALKHILHDVVWAPLGMKSTYLDLQEARDAGEKLAQGYRWDPTDKHYMAVFDPVQESSGAGGIVSNVLDYAKWLKCLLYQTGPLSNLAHREIRRPRMIDEPAPTAGYDVMLYGLGWSRTVFHGQAMYSHSGATGAFGTFVFWLPDVKYAIAIFANTAGTSNSVETLLARRLIQDRLKIPKDLRIDMSQQLKRELQELRDYISNAVDVLYPDRPSPRLPPTQNTSNLVGTYFDPGYGTIQLKEEADPDDDDASTVLVGCRGGIIIDFDVLLRRVSGDYWVLYLSSAEVPLEMGTALAAEFKFGSHGNASALEVIWDRAKPGLREVKILFHKVD